MSGPEWNGSATAAVAQESRRLERPLFYHAFSFAGRLEYVREAARASLISNGVLQPKRPEQPSRKARLWSWCFFLPPPLVLFSAVFLPQRHHVSSSLEWLGMGLVVVTLFRKGPAISPAQLVFSLIVCTLAPAYCCVALWNSPAVLLAVPALLFFAVFDWVVLRAWMQRRRSVTVHASACAG